MSQSILVVDERRGSERFTAKSGSPSAPITNNILEQLRNLVPCRKFISCNICVITFRTADYIAEMQGHLSVL